MTDRIVDVWIRDTSTPVGRPPGAGADLLDEQERERWSLLVEPQAALAYLDLHVLARTEIGRLQGRSPASLRFDRTCPDCSRQHGAPRLLDDPGMQVSLSRSGAVVALALSRVGPVGTDVEQVARTQFRGFAGVALHPDERTHVLTTVDLATSWVRKEAVLKALGVGLRVDPTTLRTPRPGVPHAVLAGRPHVTVHDVVAPQGYAAAVAVVGATDPSGAVGDLTIRRH